MDTVNHPEYYKPENGIECIDAMIQQFGVEATANFCMLNAFKYLWRCKGKHETPTEDIRKAEWYLSKLLELKINEELRVEVEARAHGPVPPRGLGSSARDA